MALNQNQINAQQMMNATVNDVAKKYGFDFSQDYANRQAEAIAQAKRNANTQMSRENQTMNQQTMKQIDMNLREGNQALDHSFFRNYLDQRQKQANTGMNAGIASEQDLRLGMNQQSAMSNLYRDASLARNQESQRFTNQSLALKDAASLIEQEKQAQAQQLFQELRKLGFDVLGQERNYGLGLDQYETSKAQQAWERKMAEQKFAWEKQIESARLAAQRASQAYSQQQKEKAVKQLSKTNSYNQALAYWADRVDDIRKDGAARTETALRNDPAALRQFIDAGYNVEGVIDAMYNVASGGRFTNQSAYDKYSQSLRNQF